ncbi:MAG: hypothetical protein ACFN38_01025 [Campylobacter sp.]|nr:hypothetical protein [uncultured Campylobacter sp.]
MSAFKTVKFMHLDAKFELSNLTMAFAKFKTHSCKFGATKSKI